MEEFISELPNIHFGEASEEPSEDWRAVLSDEADVDDDAPASDELIAQLGFDPDDIEE